VATLKRMPHKRKIDPNLQQSKKLKKRLPQRQQILIQSLQQSKKPQFSHSFAVFVALVMISKRVHT
jgi:hypothetical protein